MIFNKEKYFEAHGFKRDPFASTNAIHEDFLDEYFITPPYFYSLIGSTTCPKSTFVVAPRGTGKTAQRIMLEKVSEEDDSLLTIVYDKFPVEGVQKSENIGLDDHLIRIIKYLIIALLTEINERDLKKDLSSYERDTLKNLIEIYLNGISTSEVNSAIKSIKGIKGKISDLWKLAGNPISSVINSILEAKGLGSVDLTLRKVSMISNKSDEIMSHIDFIEDVFNHIGIKAVYILVDSIDETVLTGNDAKKSYNLIKPFIKDLRILERDTIVFKFFVWDQIEEYWSSDIRKDRMDIFSIEWNEDEIKRLMAERLKAYSSGKVTMLNQIMDCKEDIIELIYVFANNSPRDLINILKSIFDEHLRISNDLNSIPSEETVIKGIESFCKNKFEELITQDKQRRELKRIKIATFTIPHLYNDVFRCEASSARNILMPWTRAGIVLTSNNKIKVAKSKNPINIYTFSDIRIARHVCSNQKFSEFLKRNVVKCEECSSINIFDKNNTYGVNSWQCKECLSELQI